ncbi:MAG: hypothetical protein ACK5KM_14225 [Hyphomicrobiaceae bacterium]
MFDAITQKKASLKTVIDGLGKQPREDLITSQLFGTIRFLEHAARKQALEILTGHPLSGEADIHLWPRFGPGRGTEPDVVITLKQGEIVKYWIIEVKWGARFSGEGNQPHREIAAVRDADTRTGAFTSAPREVAGYTLLGAESKHDAEMKDVEELETSLSVYSLRWPEVNQSLKRLSKEAADSGLAAWAKCAADFLSSTPQGFALGNWPAMPTPEITRFTFDTNRRFEWDVSCEPVSVCQFHFDMN